MAIHDNTYSRMVAWLKIALPLVALGILSTLFLLARQLDPEQAIPFAEVDVERLAREQRVTAPTYSGMTTDGAAIAIAAGSVRPDVDNPRRLTATVLTARMDLPDASAVTLEAGRGVVDTAERFMAMTGGVEIASTNGYLIRTESMLSSLDRTDAETGGPVSARSPMGDIESGRMLLTEGADGRYVLIFNEGVKLLYQP